MPEELNNLLADEVIQLVGENELLAALDKVTSIPMFRSRAILLRRDLIRVLDDYNDGSISVAERNTEENKIARRIISLVSETRASPAIRPSAELSDVASRAQSQEGSSESEVIIDGDELHHTKSILAQLLGGSAHDTFSGIKRRKWSYYLILASLLIAILGPSMMDYLYYPFFFWIHYPEEGMLAYVLGALAISIVLFYPPLRRLNALFQRHRKAYSLGSGLLVALSVLMLWWPLYILRPSLTFDEEFQIATLSCVLLAIGVRLLHLALTSDKNL